MLSQPPFSSNSNALFFIKHFTVWNLQLLYKRTSHNRETFYYFFSNWAEIFINIILIFIFLTIHCLIFKKGIHNTYGIKNTTFFKKAVMSLIAGTGVSGVSYLWIMVAKNTPDFDKVLLQWRQQTTLLNLEACYSSY